MVNNPQSQRPYNVFDMINSDKLALHMQFGCGFGPKLVLLHGLGASGRYWLAAADLLKAKYHIASYDLPAEPCTVLDGANVVADMKITNTYSQGCQWETSGRNLKVVVFGNGANVDELFADNGCPQHTTAVAGVLALVIVISGCYKYYKVNDHDPGKTFANDWYAGIPLESVNITSCTVTLYPGFSDGSGYVCRSIDGVEGANDPGNWFVDPGGERDLSDNGIVQIAGTSSSSRGATLVMEDDKTFEGCSWQSPNNTWFCDYMVTIYTIPFDTTSGYNYVAEGKKFLDRTVNELECAATISAGVYLGKVWTVPGLYACGVVMT